MLVNSDSTIKISLWKVWEVSVGTLTEIFQWCEISKTGILGKSKEHNFLKNAQCLMYSRHCWNLLQILFNFMWFSSPFYKWRNQDTEDSSVTQGHKVSDGVTVWAGHSSCGAPDPPAPSHLNPSERTTDMEEPQPQCWPDFPKEDPGSGRMLSASRKPHGSHRSTGLGLPILECSLQMHRGGLGVQD